MELIRSYSIYKNDIEMDFNKLNRHSKVIVTLWAFTVFRVTTRCHNPEDRN
jgi:hypothetical protein